MDNQNTTNPKFADGMYVDKPNPKAPEWIKGKISIKVDEFIPFLEANKNVGGFVNIDIKEAKTGKLYASLNEYKKGTLKDPTITEEEAIASMPPVVEEPANDIPF